MKPTEMPQLLLIAGTGRNTGKTTFACHILRKFSAGHSVISLKITPHFHLLFDGEKMDFNPCHRNPQQSMDIKKLIR